MGELEMKTLLLFVMLLTASILIIDYLHHRHLSLQATTQGLDLKRHALEKRSEHLTQHWSAARSAINQKREAYVIKNPQHAIKSARF